MPVKLYYSSNPIFTVEDTDVMGLICSVSSKSLRRNFMRNVPCHWCLDSGTYNAELNFRQWVTMLEHGKEFRDTCDFVVVPDKWDDPDTTMTMFKKYFDIPKTMGYPIAFCLQGNISIDKIPLSEVDYIFLGSNDTYRASDECFSLLDKIKTIGKKVHIGRVNSVKRIGIYKKYDSWDGTHLTRHYADKDRFVNYVRSIV